MAQSFHYREQAERCRRLARDCTDPGLCDNLLELAAEYAERAAALEGQQAAIRNARADD
jgi:hypothetical protein